MGAQLEKELRSDGFRVSEQERSGKLSNFAGQHPSVRFIYLDVGIEKYEPFSKKDTDDGSVAGLRLLEEFEKLLPKAQVYVKTASPSPEIRARALRFRAVERVSQRVTFDEIRAMAKRAYKAEAHHPEILIVHGHDRLTLQRLQNFMV